MKTQSAAHAKYKKDNPKPPTPALRYGHVLHTLALEPSTFKKRYLVAPKCLKNTKAGKDIYKQWAKGLNGKEEVAASDYASMLKLDGAIRSQKIHRFIEQGESEICIVWIDKKTGLLCKGRIDYVHRGQAVIIDLKSSLDATKEKFARDIWRYGYYQQAAFYCDGWRALTEDPPAYVFLVYEKTPPFLIAARELAAKDIIAGRLSYREQLKKYAKCVRDDYWPGYSDNVEMISMPTWALNQAGVSQYHVLSEDEEDG
jgi:exodeoxyribonuclease VIII